jgi:hypothetical protein
MSTTSTTRFAAEQTFVRRIAAGLALALTMGMLVGLDQVADAQYDEAMVAQVAQVPADQVVVITAKRLQA